jgi:hypothetical protein
MPEPTDTSTMASSLLDAWLKSATDFWSGTVPPFPAAGSGKDQEAAKDTATASSGDQPSQDENGPNKNGPAGNSRNSKTSGMADGLSFWNTNWSSGAQAWQSIFSGLKLPDSPIPGFPETGSFQETLAKMTGPVFSAVNTMIGEWMQQSGTAGGGTGKFNFDSLDKDALAIWKTIYDNAFRKFLKAPQLGLMREHQERVARFFDRFTLLETALAEFLGVLSIPFKQSFDDFQKKLTELAATGKAPTEPNDYYKIWLRILEGHYMTLFQSPDYIQTLAKTLAASAAYTRAKKELISDVLGQWSIPSSNAMDALYQELHVLKKRMKQIEKQLTSNGDGR